MHADAIPPSGEKRIANSEQPIAQTEEGIAKSPQPPLAVPHCMHVKEDGAYCRQPAVRRQQLCFSHLRLRGRRARMVRERNRRLALPLVFPVLEDIRAVNAAIQMATDARALGRITERDCGLYLYAFRQVGANLKFMEQMALARAQSGLPPPDADAEYAIEYPKAEAEFGLPEGVDLAQPTELLFDQGGADGLEICPHCGHSERDSLRERCHDPRSLRLVTPEEVELEEVLAKQGREAYNKRSAEVQRKLWRTVELERRESDRARWVLEADRRTEEMRFGTPEERAQWRHEIEEQKRNPQNAEACRGMEEEFQASMEKWRAEHPGPGTSAPAEVGVAEAARRQAAGAGERR